MSGSNIGKQIDEAYQAGKKETLQELKEKVLGLKDVDDPEWLFENKVYISAIEDVIELIDEDINEST